MSQDPRILNVTRGFHFKRKQAQRAIDNCACIWVDYGRTVRDCTLAESIALRIQQSADREPLPNAEIPGLIFKHPDSAIASARERYALIRDANALMVM